MWIKHLGFQFPFELEAVREKGFPGSEITTHFPLHKLSHNTAMMQADSSAWTRIPKDQLRIRGRAGVLSMGFLMNAANNQIFKTPPGMTVEF